MTYETLPCDLPHRIATSSPSVITDFQKQYATGVTPGDVIVAADDFTVKELARVIDCLQGILRYKKQNRDIFDPITKPRDGSRSSGWIEQRMSNGCGPYYYERYYEGGKKKYGRYFGKRKPSLVELDSPEIAERLTEVD